MVARDGMQLKNVLIAKTEPYNWAGRMRCLRILSWFPSYLNDWLHFPWVPWDNLCFVVINYLLYFKESSIRLMVQSVIPLCTIAKLVEVLLFLWVYTHFVFVSLFLFFQQIIKKPNRSYLPYIIPIHESLLIIVQIEHC